jgi:chromosomal replication initiator protein
VHALEPSQLANNTVELDQRGGGEEMQRPEPTPQHGVPAQNAAEPNEPRAALESLWRDVQVALLGAIPRAQFETWFRRAMLVAADDHTVYFALQNKFAKDWVESNYRSEVERAVEQVYSATTTARPTVRFLIDPEIAVGPAVAMPNLPDDPSPAAGGTAPGQNPDVLVPTPPPLPGSTPTQAPNSPWNGGAASSNHVFSALPPLPGSAQPQASGVPRSPGKTRNGVLSGSDVCLNARYNFEAFVVGPCNRLAHAAALGVSERPGTLYNPFFLHGGVGYGKTHLLQSLCHALIERDPTIGILYLSCETFVNHFISALENGDLNKFRNKYRNVDVIVVDDIHILANKERTQEEFFHTFNTLYNAGKQIVLSSDSPPKEIPTLQERLVSRFKWGLVTEIERPSYETRMAILKRKARDRGQEIPDDVARILAERIDSNIRELEGAVTKLTGYAGITGRAIDTDLARECLREVFVTRRGQVTMEDILRLITEHFGVKLSDLQSRKRTNAIAYPRQVGMYLARRVTRMSLEEIGGYFGGRDHSTVLYGVRKLERLSKDDPSVQESLIELEGSLRAPPA